MKNPHNLATSISSWTFTAEIRNLNNYYPYGMSEQSEYDALELELPGGGINSPVTFFYDLVHVVYQQTYTFLFLKF